MSSSAVDSPRYDEIGRGCARTRREDPRFRERIQPPSATRRRSGFARMTPAVVDRVVSELERNLKSGDWDRRHGRLRQLDSYDVGLRLILNTPR